MRTPRAAVRTARTRSPANGRAVAEDVETDGHVADARRRERDARARAVLIARAPEIGADAQQVGEDAAGRDRRAGAGPAHDERIAVVAARA